MGDVFGCQRHGTFDIVQRARQILPRQRVHQVQIDVVEAGRARLSEGLFCLAGGVDPAQPPEHGVVETLHAKRQAVDARLAVAVEVAVFDRAGIGLERDLAVAGQVQARAHAFEKARDLRAIEKAGRAATEEDADDLAPGCGRAEIGQIRVEVGQQGIHIPRIRRLPAHAVRVEVAIGTLAHAPGHVHVQRQRDRAEPVRQGTLVARGSAHGSHVSVSRRSASAARAWPRWLMRFFRSVSSSAALCLLPSAGTAGHSQSHRYPAPHRSMRPCQRPSATSGAGSSA